MLGEITFHRLPCNRLAHRCITLSKYGVWAGISVPASHYRVTTNPGPGRLGNGPANGQKCNFKTTFGDNSIPLACHQCKLALESLDC